MRDIPAMTAPVPRAVEWLTLGLLLACFAALALATVVLPGLSLLLAALVLIVTLVLHASLTHEVIHGHPLPWRWLSEGLMLINPGLAIPYLRFRDTHLAHHQDSNLTDPYDDPESNYLEPGDWAQMPRGLQRLRQINNTLAGRMLLGPLLGQISFMVAEFGAIRRGHWQTLKGWLAHIPGAALVIWAVSQSAFPLWLYLLSCYIALSVLKIRTFLEHQAHEKARGRTVIIEDRGPLAFLFLNNNLHVVHHMHPKLPWYQLPHLYRANKSHYLRCNDGYAYRSYREIFAHYFWRAKDPVPHPLWSKRPD